MRENDKKSERKKLQKNRNEKRNRQLTNLSADHTLWRTGKKKKINGSINDNTRQTRETRETRETTRRGSQEEKRKEEINEREVCLMIHSFELFELFSPFFPAKLRYTLSVSQPSEYTEETIRYSHFSLIHLPYVQNTFSQPGEEREERENCMILILDDCWDCWDCWRCFFFSPPSLPPLPPPRRHRIVDSFYITSHFRVIDTVISLPSLS